MIMIWIMAVMLWAVVIPLQKIVILIYNKWKMRDHHCDFIIMGCDIDERET